VFQGRTEDAEAPFLDAGFWKEGVKVTGLVERSWESENGECYVLTLSDSVTLKIGDAETEVETISIGNMTGFRMAMDAAKCKKLVPGDYVTLECTGIKKATKPGHSPRPNFDVKVIRKPQEDDAPY